jgi:organic radical activating enzyme
LGVKAFDVIRALGSILKGGRPSLSIEITRECPLRCPGCYAYEDAHLGGGGVTLRSLRDLKGQALVDGVLATVDRLRPLHLSLVGGDPLVRYREVETLVPVLLHRGIHVGGHQRLPSAAGRLGVCISTAVSIDLQAEHDVSALRHLIASKTCRAEHRSIARHQPDDEAPVAGVSWSGRRRSGVAPGLFTTR